MAMDVSVAPHIKSELLTKNIMRAVALSLIPSGIAGVYIFGMRSLYIIIISIISAVATETAILSFRKKDIAVWDTSAVLTGLLLAYNLPPQVPLWIPAVGAFFAIAVGKQLFGGLGHNIFNPALVGRAFLMVSWPLYMTTWQNPRSWVHATTAATTAATPLALFKHNGMGFLKNISYWDLLIGNRGGCIGEVCIIALLAGAAYLLYKRYITFDIPASYILTVGFTSWVFNGKSGLFAGDGLFFILSGGLMLGALFMATDYVTSPLSAKGRIIFGMGCGLLTFIIRRFAGYPEGVSYSILMMNAAAPIIDRYTVPKWFGYIKDKRTAPHPNPLPACRE